ncbi:MAG TPA: acyl-CoA dehydrogenase [Actinomycetota bacterium]|nr:acyl-CoA dehydrogenase [Actinomycetota bacterium]
MDIRLTEEDRALQDRAREFTERYLLPYELECEENEGLSGESLRTIRSAVIEWRFNAINHRPEDGGQGHDLFEQTLIEEEWGKATGALWDVPWRPSIPMRAGTEAQKDEYLRPACRGERRDAYAITEEGAGSDPTMVQTIAKRDGGDFVLEGEKWHVTTGDVADFLLVHAHVDGDPGKATVFFVDKDLPGVEVVRVPKYMHTFVFEHPIFRLDGVRVPGDKVLGEVGQGFDLTKEWFVEERLMIAARTVGASIRALELSVAFARGRVAFGRPIIEYQGVGFQLADMAAEIAAAKSLLYRTSWQIARGETTARERHGQAAVAKLVCSEIAGRVIDRAVQVHGGRGYMRENPVERLWRELRVDRIWEGTSEIQRAAILNELRKRGPGAFTAWPT